MPRVNPPEWLLIPAHGNAQVIGQNLFRDSADRCSARICKLLCNSYSVSKTVICDVMPDWRYRPCHHSQCEKDLFSFRGSLSPSSYFMKIEALCAAPPEALTHSPSQMPLSCPVAPQAARYDAGLITSNPSAFAHSDTRRTPLRAADRAPPRPRPPHLLV